MPNPNYQPLIEVYRGSVVESIIYGAITVVNPSGDVLFRVGDPEIVTYPRSTNKPLQVLPYVEAGGVEKFNLTERELALLCASHSGTDEHVSVVQSIQSKIGASESDLLCGTHYPLNQASTHEMIRRGETPTPNRHNCSGKHTGMLAYANLRGVSKEDYINPEHPIQKTILQTYSEMVGVPVSDIPIGIDGCSAPVFAVPLRNLAWGFAKMADPSSLSPVRAAACQKIFKAMAANGDMVAGPDRFDTLVMAAAHGTLMSKGGAEGYQGIALLPGTSSASPTALGIAIKIADGDQSGRACPIVGVEVLRQLGALTIDQLAELSSLDARPQYNWRKIEVGRYQPVFRLK